MIKVLLVHLYCRDTFPGSHSRCTSVQLSIGATVPADCGGILGVGPYVASVPVG